MLQCAIIEYWNRRHEGYSIGLPTLKHQIIKKIKCQPIKEKNRRTLPN